MGTNTTASFKPTRGQLGTVAVFAVAAIAFVGYAVDTNNIHAAKSNLQNVIDVATMSLVRDIDRKSDEELRTSLAKLIESHIFADDDLKSLTVAVDRKKHKLMANATLRVESTITSLVGPDHVDVTASSETIAAN